MGGTVMTDKRFTSDYNGDEHLLTHFLNNGKPMTKGEVLNHLNEVEEENEELKKELEDALLDVKIYKNANTTFYNVYQENEKLKSRIEYLERKIERERNATNKQYEKWEKEALEKINKLEKENAFLTVEVEALKQINPIRKLPRELTVLKLDDGDVE